MFNNTILIFFSFFKVIKSKFRNKNNMTQSRIIFENVKLSLKFSFLLL